jgi:hypothetical protein
MAATAPKTSAMGLELSDAAAPVLWGIPPVDEDEPVGLLVPEAERERVGEATVELRPAEGMMEAEAAAVEALELKLARTEETEARALEAAAEADETAAEAEATAEETTEETAAEPPVRPNWPE